MIRVCIPSGILLFSSSIFIALPSSKIVKGFSSEIMVLFSPKEMKSFFSFSLVASIRFTTISSGRSSTVGILVSSNTLDSIVSIFKRFCLLLSGKAFTFLTISSIVLKTLAS